MTFYGRIRIREKGPDPTGSGSATLLLPLCCFQILGAVL